MQYFSRCCFFWCQLSVLLTCQKVKLWMLWESICFSVIRIGCKHFWEVWLKFEHIFQIRLSKIQCCCRIAQKLIGCYNFSFYFVWIHWKSKGKKSCKVSKNCQFAILKKSQRRGMLNFPCQTGSSNRSVRKNWKSTLLILVSKFHVRFGFSFVLWFPNSFGVMLLMFHFLSTMWALILSFTFSVSKNPFELDWLWKNLWVGREVASQ